MVVSDRTLISLAILKVNMDGRRSDPIDNFVPFVAEALRVAPSGEVSLSFLQSTITEDFGIHIPQAALKTILSRAGKRGIVKRKHGVYYRDDDTIAALDFNRTRQMVLRHHEALVDKLVTFCREHHDVIWSREEAESALLSYLSNQSLPILEGAVNGQPIKAPKLPGKGSKYLIAGFAHRLYTSDPEGFAYLESIVKGTMLADALLYPELGQVGESFNRVEVYFDTEFLLRALSLEGEQLQAPCLELIALLREAKAELRCFDHTLDELRGIVERAARALRNRTYMRTINSGVLEHYIQQGRTASDAELDLARIEQSLRNLGINVKTMPRFSLPLSVDEIRLSDVLKDIVGYQYENALEHDRKSIVGIHRLRQGQASNRLERCRAVFITTNMSLAKASTTFFREEGNIQTSGVAHCLSFHVFTTLVWLKKPLRAPELPRKRIIADCYAAMNPDDKLWKRYLTEIEKLCGRGDIRKEDYDLLRLSNDAKVALMDITLGDDDVFSEGTISEVLERAYANARREAEEAHAQTQAALNAERTARIEAERLAAHAQQSVVSIEHERNADRTAIRTRCQEISEKAARLISTVIWFIGLLALGFLTYAMMPDPLRWTPASWGDHLVPTVSALATLVLALVGLASFINGTTLRALVHRCEIWIAKSVERLLVRVLMPLR